MPEGNKIAKRPIEGLGDNWFVALWDTFATVILSIVMGKSTR